MAQLQQLIESDRVRQFTFEQLYQDLRPSSPEALALLLTDLVERGEARRVFRVQSPFSGRGLGDFERLEEVPTTIEDHFAEREFSPSTSDVRVIYFVGGKGQSSGEAGGPSGPGSGIIGRLLGHWRRLKHERTVSGLA